MQEMHAHGLTELDAAELVSVNGGDLTPDPDDAWTWFWDKVAGPQKHGPDEQTLTPTY